jgi:selenocysteine lyase/cysteine desulfurase
VPEREREARAASRSAPDAARAPLDPDAAPAPLDPDAARALFPGLSEVVYLATNGQALLPAPARDRLVAAAQDLAQRGFAAAAALEAEIETVRAKVARLVGAEPAEIGFVRNTAEGLGFAADAVDWRPGDEVLVFAGEYRSVVHAFQGAAHRGVSVRVAATDAGRVTPERVAAELRERTRAVALSWVRYDNGARADLAAIGALLHDAGALFVVDAIQGLGALPLDVRAARVSLLAAGAHKWLLGVSGTGILYVARELLPDLLPVRLGVGSMSDAAALHVAGDPYEVRLSPAARRVEAGAQNALGLAALGASLDLLDRVGPDAIASRIRRLTDRLCEGVRAAGGRVRSPRGAGEWSGILLLEPPPGADAAALARRMLRERIVVGAREGALWGGVHFFVSDADVERVLGLFRLAPG